ncbi:MAG TPA: hypothetical protein VHV75_06560 [Solirubrobacteraceae bacterium]|nr:hypothetical protein [Solirubrobacteraceae bacterium]
MSSLLYVHRHGHQPPRIVIGQLEQHHRRAVRTDDLDSLTATTTVSYTVAAAATVPPNTFTVKSVKVSRSGVITVSLTKLHGSGTVTKTIKLPRL